MLRWIALLLAVASGATPLAAQGFAGALRVRDERVLLIPSSPSLEPSGPFTIECWIKGDNSYAPGRIVRKMAPNGAGYALDFGGPLQRIQGSVVNSASWAPISDVRDNGAYWRIWTHVAFSVTPGVSMDLFVNGAHVRSVPTLQLVEHSGDFVVGGSVLPSGISEEFVGYVDELRFWRVARSEAEIARDRFRRLSSGPGLVSVWHFDGDLLDAYGTNHGIALGAEVDPSDSPVALGFDLSSTSGAWSGGEVLELRGYFPTGTPSVEFDGMAASSVRMLDPQTIEVVVPPGSAGRSAPVRATFGRETRTASTPYDYLPRLSMPNTARPGSQLELRVELPAPGSLLLFTALAPAINVSFPPLGGALRLQPPVVELLAEPAPFTAVELALELPDDPALIGLALLFQGLYLRSGAALSGTFTNHRRLDIGS
ncbi:MAG: hypothetical protein IPN34_15205 [Planctomycetes bacterium]|nr:hypothetical protein [Planctomycetota bacterium]